MKYINRALLITVVVMLVFTASGCGRDDSIMEDAALVYMESTPVVDYTVPELTPNILVDRVGYSTSEAKEAVLKGSRLSEEFRIVAAQTGEVVYSGIIEKASYSDDSGIYTGYADFYDLALEGEYYIESDYIGRSYSFVIKNGIYNEMFKELYSRLEADCEAGIAEIGDVMTMLLAYEFYGEIFEDEDGNEVPDVMELLEEWTQNINYSQIEAGYGARYAAFLAKFSYLYQKYDITYATECLQRASAVFTQTKDAVQNDADTFFALTELYRATGIYTYRTQILDYKTYFQNNSGFVEEAGYLYGAMTYMVTRQKVDLELCTLFMDSLMSHGEEIADRSEDMLHPINEKNNGAEEILDSAIELACANYVLDSYKYDCLMQDFCHYLMGRNRMSVCFYPEEGSRSSYFMLAAQLASQEMAE
ncbi:MAG: glycoside hydrolase family 9 protein [Lachnospiraceae bacterium]|nr:glycoside hydrolase family 9 protein [Lachnospiraceae bacterium]